MVSQSFTVPRGVAGARQRATSIGWHRKLQLALAVLWLLDGVLQYQPSMFGKDFPQMLSGTAQGNPAVVASPITWSATLIAHHQAALNVLFATIQVALGLGIAFRRTVKPALAASVGWSLAVWWLGEGLGGVLTGSASAITGAPGAVLLYAILAVLLWPADRAPDAPFVAARAVGRHRARAVWLAVWGTLALLTVLPAARSGSPSSDMTSGEPAWLTWTTVHTGSLLGHRALLAAVLIVVALGVCLPAGLTRPVLVLALALSAALWLAQGLGGLLAGSATDPSSAPLLALLALAFWPRPDLVREPLWPGPPGSPSRSRF